MPQYAQRHRLWQTCGSTVPKAAMRGTGAEPRAWRPQICGKLELHKFEQPPSDGAGRTGAWIT
jgi:hypothetical protein